MMELAPYAATDTASRGRVHPEHAPEYRSGYQRDRDRIIHSAAFRRLEYKTQVFVNHEGDLFRTRLTHSIEVAQIARSVARALGLNEDLTEAISLAHDLGHTPFGHAGQDALNHCMKAHGGFEHNLQSLRVVELLEERYAEFPGLNLTFEAREGILKHCSVKTAHTLGDLGKRFIDKTEATAEAQLVNLADEIAYNNHDVDDGLRYGLISLAQLRELPLFARQFEKVIEQYPALDERRTIHETIRRMINYLAVDLIETSKRLIHKTGVDHPDAVRAAGRPVVAFSDEVREETLALKRFLRNELYNHYRVRRMTQKSVRVISELFAAFDADPALLPPQYQKKISENERNEPPARIISDYIAGMTDRFAVREYERLFTIEAPV